ncbi:MAG: class I SAM-dependent methyltransferase [Iamia sp.]
MAALEDATPGDRWEGERVERWIRQSAGLERQLEPVSEALFAAAQLQPGERVLDVGCGTGPTTRRAARDVGAQGAVTGLDVASPMLERAAEIRTEPGVATIEWVVADAADWDPGKSRFDVVLSRFGVMFFDDPPAAFAALAQATRPGGRLHVAVWARRDQSELFELPLQVALAAVGDEVGADVPPVDGGPFSMGDAAEVLGLLGGAGWSEVVWDEQQVTLLMGGGLSPAEAAVATLDFGPTRLVATGLDDEARDRMVAAITEAYQEHLDPDGHVTLDGTIIIVSATRPDTTALADVASWGPAEDWSDWNEQTP